MVFSIQQSLANFYPIFETHLKYHFLNEVFLEYLRVYFRFCVPYSSLYIPLIAFHNVIDFYDYLLIQTKAPLKKGQYSFKHFCDIYNVPDTVDLGRLRGGCAQTTGISCAWAKWLRAETLESDLLSTNSDSTIWLC